MFYENFLKLCNKKNMKPNQVTKAIGLSTATATDWKNGSVPRDITLQKLADYFGVTVDDLRSDKPNYTTFISYKSEEKPEIDLQGSERIWQENNCECVEEPDCSFESTNEKSNPDMTRLDEYEKKLIGTFRETTIDGKLRILNAADEIKKEIEKNHTGSDSSFA